MAGWVECSHFWDEERDLWSFRVTHPEALRMESSGFLSARESAELKRCLKEYRSAIWQDYRARLDRGTLEKGYPAVRPAFEMLLPRALSAELFESPVKLKTSHPELPWELVFQKVCRDVPRGRAKGEGLREPRILFLTDPEGLVTWRTSFAERVKELEPRGASVTILQKDEASLPNLESALETGEVGVLHLSAYAGTNRIYFGDRRLGSGDLKALPGLPDLVVLDLVTVSDDPGRVLCGWAEAWLRAGVRSVLGTITEREPAESETVLLEFYRAILQDKTLAQAHAQAEGEIPIYGVWGDPDFKLSNAQSLVPALEATQASSLKVDLEMVVSSGPDSGLEIPFVKEALNGNPVYFGGDRAPGADIPLQGCGLASRAIRLEVRHGEFYLFNETGDPQNLKINGLPVAACAALSGGDTVALGQTAMSVKLAPFQSAEPPPVEQRGFRLKVIQGPDSDQGKEIVSDSGVTLVGRDGDLKLSESSISRHHFSVFLREERAHISPTGSTPTLLNGRVIKGESPLRHGDRVQIGDSTVVVFERDRA